MRGARLLPHPESHVDRGVGFRGIRIVALDSVALEGTLTRLRYLNSLQGSQHLIVRRADEVLAVDVECSEQFFDGGAAVFKIPILAQHRFDLAEFSEPIDLIQMQTDVAAGQ